MWIVVTAAVTAALAPARCPALRGVLGTLTRDRGATATGRRSECPLCSLASVLLSRRLEVAAVPAGAHGWGHAPDGRPEVSGASAEPCQLPRAGKANRGRALPSSGRLPLGRADLESLRTVNKPLSRLRALGATPGRPCPSPAASAWHLPFPSRPVPSGLRRSVYCSATTGPISLQYYCKLDIPC